MLDGGKAWTTGAGQGEKQRAKEREEDREDQEIFNGKDRSPKRMPGRRISKSVSLVLPFS